MVENGGACKSMTANENSRIVRAHPWWGGESDGLWGKRFVRVRRGTRVGGSYGGEGMSEAENDLEVVVVFSFSIVLFLLLIFIFSLSSFVMVMVVMFVGW